MLSLRVDIEIYGDAKSVVLVVWTNGRK
jgi:hypothetical protein